MVVLAAALVSAAVTDLRSGRIYNWITYPAIAAGLVGHTLFGGLAGNAAAMGLSDALLGMATGFGPMLVVWLMGGIGGGDAKLSAAVGALAGWRFALATMFYGLIVAAAMAVIVILHRRVARRTVMRIFRFLYLIFTPAKPADPAGEDSPKIPFGLALCIGAALALVELAIRGADANKLLLGI